MNRRLKLAGAPITWGISEVPGWGEQLDREKVISEIRSAGLTATELGPRGFLPEDPAEVKSLLQRHGLSLVAGFVPAVLHKIDILASELRKVEASARTLAGAGAQILVLAAETGATGYESSARLSETEWQTLAEGVSAVQNIGERYGLKVTLHPHYGTVIENAEQILRVLAQTDVKLCLDTGHLMVAGADPVAITRAANSRIAHVHLKDVDAKLAGRVQRGEIGYRDAVRDGLYKPLGDGDVDLRTVMGMLASANYSGWFVLEQDLVIENGRNGSTPFENVTRSVRFMESLTEV